MRARPVTTMFLLAGISLGISVILAGVAPLPQPQFHDEFSYLLAADTFAHGRITNPTHKLWKFFETFQEIQRPTYQSKYQPGQAMVLALGQLIGQPIFGVWLSTAAAVAATWWSMGGFVSKRLALIGALIVAAHPLVLRWNWSYWGGTLPMIGGLLVVGAIGRLRHSARASSGIALGLGIAILLLTRPFEGTIAAVLCSALLYPRRAFFANSGKEKTIAQVAGIIALTFAFQCYYNYRTTRRAFTPPYQVYESAYAVCPPVIWLPKSTGVPDYNNAPLREYYLKWELPAYERQRTFAGFFEAMREKAWTFSRSYFEAFGLAIPVITVPLVWKRDRTLRRAVVASIIFTGIVFGNLWFFPHYAAAGIGLYLVALLRAMKHLNRHVVTLVLVLQLGSCLWWGAQLARRGREEWNFQRADLIEQLKESGGKHLIIVRSTPGAYTHNEWVYNAADIDASPVVWARDLADDANRELFEYFPERRAWLMTISERGSKIDPIQRPN